ncbi:hypothetical protein JHK86_038983 [Glycine max]|nr:hypothetical protein JHK86_038983 [Glycine max]
MATIDKVCMEEANSFVMFDPDIVRGLCKRGLVYFDVPIYPEDRFKVSRLEGFVSKREQSYEDPIEELLYAVFVVSNENVTVRDLATTLQADLSQLQAAAAFGCRLGWATKVLDPESIIGDSTILASPVASLKSHAVTLSCKDLSTLEGATYEGELQEFANHLFSLRCVLECLQSGGIVTNIKEEGSSDKLSMITSSNDGPKLVEASIYTDRVSSGIDDETRSITSDDSSDHIHEADKAHTKFDGQCLRLLPAPLAGCEKALIWSWDGSTIGELGRKLEGNLVKGSILLQCLNSLLKHSAVLVLPLGRCDLNEHGKLTTLDTPLPLKNADGSIPSVGKELGLNEKEDSKLNSLLTNLANKMKLWTVGYIRLLKLFNGTKSDQFSSEEKYAWVPLSVEFGMPLFSPTLCNSPITKLLYQKEQAFGQPMDPASGRWNSLVDLSPISGALSVRQRLKLVNRQHWQNEILSCDGSFLSSQDSLEAVTTNTIKTEPEEIDSKEAILRGVNLIFDGSRLLPFDIGACLQACQPISLIIDAAAASTYAPFK